MGLQIDARALTGRFAAVAKMGPVETSRMRYRAGTMASLSKRDAHLIAPGATQRPEAAALEHRSLASEVTA